MSTTTAPRPWPLRRLLLAAYLGLLGAALFVLSLGIRGLVERYLDQALERTARETAAEAWGRLGLPETEFWSLQTRGGVVVAQSLTNRHLDQLVTDLARPERIVRWRTVGSPVIVQAGGRPRKGVGVAPPPPDVHWWALTLATPNGPLGVLEMGLDRRADRHLLEALGHYLFLCSMAVLLLAILVSWRLSRTLLAPLNELDKTLEALAGGDLTARPPKTEGTVVPIEWRRLRHSAEMMAMRLESSFNAQRRFISDASHELRTPLTAVAAMAELLEAEEIPEASRRKALVTISKETHRMSRLVEDLLALSRADEGRPLPNGSCHLMETLVSLRDELMESHPGRNVEIQGSPEATVGAPETFVRTVLRNLMENALRYSDKSVTCRVEMSSEEVRVLVTDEGCGIAPEEREKVFERFFRSDCSRSRGTGGSGLGLAIVKTMVAQTGGQVWLESQLGEGTTVTVVWKGIQTENEPHDLSR